MCNYVSLHLSNRGSIATQMPQIGLFQYLSPPSSVTWGFSAYLAFSMPSRKCWISAESDHCQSPKLMRGVQWQRSWWVSWILRRPHRRTPPQLHLGGWVTNQTEQTPDQVSTNWTCQHLRSAPGRICCAMTSCAGWNSGNICFKLNLILNCSSDHRKSIHYSRDVCDVREFNTTTQIMLK